MVHTSLKFIIVIIALAPALAVPVIIEELDPAYKDPDHKPQNVQPAVALDAPFVPGPLAARIPDHFNKHFETEYRGKAHIDLGNENVFIASRKRPGSKGPRRYFTKDPHPAGMYGPMRTRPAMRNNHPYETQTTDDPARKLEAAAPPQADGLASSKRLEAADARGKGKAPMFPPHPPP